MRACMALGTQQQSGMKIVLYFTLCKQQSYCSAKMFKSSQMLSKCIRAVIKGFSIISWMRLSHQIHHNEDHTWCKMSYQKPNDVMKLWNDLQTGPKHYLEYRKYCDPFWCSEAAKVDVNLHNLPLSLLFEIDRAGEHLVSKAAQLIANSTTNLSKCYMSIRAKMDGGKQVNRIQSGSFQHHCMTAELSTLSPGLIETTLHLFVSCSSITETFRIDVNINTNKTPTENLQIHTKKPELKSDTILHQL